MDDSGNNVIHLERHGWPGDDDRDPKHEAAAPGDVFATVTGQRKAPALEFITLGGEAFVIPYSYRPLLWWRPPDGIVIEYPTLFSVSLRGKNLGGLYARIRDQRVTWVRQMNEEQAERLPSAVTVIEIIHAYPSRAGNTEDADVER